MLRGEKLLRYDDTTIYILYYYILVVRYVFECYLCRYKRRLRHIKEMYRGSNMASFDGYFLFRCNFLFVFQPIMQCFTSEKRESYGSIYSKTAEWIVLYV